MGDIALITDTKTNELLPQLGSVAQQAGRHVGENIERLVNGKQTEPLSIRTKALWQPSVVVQLLYKMPGNGTMTGHAAWLAWLGVHLALLAGGEERVALSLIGAGIF